MRGWRSLALLGGALVLAALGGRADAAPGLIVGVADDSIKWATTPNEIVAAHKELGLGAVRITIQWKPGLSKVDADQLIYVARAQQTARLGQRVLLAVYGPAATPPGTP